MSNLNDSLPAPVARNPEEVIVRTLEISTAHVCPAGREVLSDPDQCAVTAYEKGDFGWLLYVPVDEPTPTKPTPGLPRSLIDILTYARQHNCRWVMLDCDAYIVRDLPVYDW